MYCFLESGFSSCRASDGRNSWFIQPSFSRATVFVFERVLSFSERFWVHLHLHYDHLSLSLPRYSSLTFFFSPLPMWLPRDFYFATFRSTSQSSSVSLPRMGEAMQKVVDILHAVPPESISFSKFNLSASPLLLERYRAQEGSAPIFLMYYNGKLVFAGTEMNGLGYKREDCARQIVSSFTDAKRGKTLPPTFQFDGTSINIQNQLQWIKEICMFESPRPCECVVPYFYHKFL